MKKLISILSAALLFACATVGVSATETESVETVDVPSITEEVETEATETETETEAETTAITTEASITTTVVENANADKVAELVKVNSEVNGKVEKNDKTKVVTFTGENKDVNVFDITDLTLTDEYAFDFKIPEFSYVIVKVGGTDVKLSTQSGVSYNGTDVKIASHVLYDLSAAESVLLEGEGAFYGTIYAPNAIVSVNSKEVFVVGEIIAKAYDATIKTDGTTFNYWVKKDTTVNSTVLTNTTSTTKVTEAAPPRTGRDYNLSNLAILSFAFVAIMIVAAVSYHSITKKD